MIDQQQPTVEHPIRVILVDDSSDVRYLLSATMEFDGRFKVIGEAECATDAVPMIAEMDPDLVMIDLQMGGRDGIWLITQLRQQGTDAVLSVVTGSPIEQATADALEAGADSVHEKMSMTSTMVEDLADIVASRRIEVPSPAA